MNEHLGVNRQSVTTTKNTQDSGVDQTNMAKATLPFTIHRDAKKPVLPDGDLWVFGYGSLMWRPGFKFLEKADATIFGYHRALCVSSWVHRGTQENPGLVLGLDRGGSCLGKVFKVCNSHKEAVAEYLYARELPTLVYTAKMVNVYIKELNSTRPRAINALTFVVDTKHPQYTTGKTAEQLAKIVSTTSGVSGHSKDYLFSTLEALRFSGIKDSKLEEIASFVEG